MSQQTIASAQTRRLAQHAVAGALHARRVIAAPHHSEGLPYGQRFNFGIAFMGSGILVYGGILYAAGVKLEWAEPADVTEPTIETLANNDIVCVVYTIATQATSIAVRSPAQDYGGEVIRGLCKVSVAGGVARLAKWYGGGIDLGIKGGAY